MYTRRASICDVVGIAKPSLVATMMVLSRLIEVFDNAEEDHPDKRVFYDCIHAISRLLSDCTGMTAEEFDTSQQEIAREWRMVHLLGGQHGE